MRILHLDSGREMRGGQHQVLHLHKGLLELGHESRLLARPEGPLLQAAQAAGLPCDALRPLQLRAATRACDLVHAHDAHSHTLAALLSARPFVVSRRVAFPIRRSRASQWKYTQPERFLAVSRFVARQLYEAGIDGDSIDIVYDGVPVPETPAAGDLLVTPYSEDSGKCMALAQEAAALAGIPIHTSHNLEQDLPRACALLYLSSSEGLGSGVLLGMAHGVAVLASNTGGIPELIDNGVTGLLTINEAPAIATALMQLDRHLGPAARQKVLERFTIGHMVGATVESYLKALRV